jgi:hypothetical protein
LFNLSVEGVLNRAADRWSVESFDGQTHPLPLTEMLVGHHARVASATVVDIDKMREALERNGGSDMVEELVGRADDLRDILSRIRPGGR